MRLSSVSIAAFIAVLGLGSVARADDAAVERMFKSKCAACHGNDGKGKTKQGEKMKIGDMTAAAFKKEASPDKIRKTILDGVDRQKEGVKQEMKPLRGKITDEQVEELVAYVRGLK